jgi:catechol 2,3-dioxygenase-like lactoylglutathione lyase family enzyme
MNIKTTLLAFAIAALVFPHASADQTDIPLPMVSQHLNIVHSVSSADKTNEFYGDILGLKRIPDLDFPGDTFMIRYMGGTTEVKFIVYGREMQKKPGGIDTAIGIRWTTYNIPSNKKSAIVNGLKEKGYPILESNDSRGDVIATRDHDDNQVEIHFRGPNTPASEFKKFEIGLTVSSLEKSQEWLGRVMKYAANETITLKDGSKEPSFQAGDTRLKLRSFEKELPTYAVGPSSGFGLNLVQHIVRSVPESRELIVERGGSIHTEPFPLGKMATIMFANDDDGILYEFAGPAIRAEK